MKKQILIIGTVLAITFTSQAQDISQNQIPSVIINNFNTQYPKATDIEWEVDGNLYYVDFEIGWNTDHEIWYNNKGKMVKHKHDIAKNKLPQAVNNKIKSEFNGYTVSDLEEITDHGKVFYKMELEAVLKQDWDVIVGNNGNILSKVAD
ncbi:PepSY-like domain-containing protein [Cellulophaga baltica]|uniref:PepSY-like domain-containing protein n=1 Tax=Cellulophaga TaxID=104264 RepID=UPI001C0796CB|nr:MULTISPECIES: PepSY-like domain-containing protein [Cellulophaga]MBU2994855.1 PepSY-like domain-containing protein [Cellulophaga baltica]MDO6766250.1 PepSY-like domain-containing protein [Cellulophaga sp. 1_MG-2023]